METPADALSVAKHDRLCSALGHGLAPGLVTGLCRIRLPVARAADRPSRSTRNRSSTGVREDRQSSSTAGSTIESSSAREIPDRRPRQALGCGAGPRCVRAAEWRQRVAYLLGDFAFALRDPGSQRLLMARDALGMRPISYVTAPGFVAFATEPRQLTRLQHGRTSS